MLDSDTKRRIDTARDILVGKVPDPKSQVEQITIALIYKFMDDMDAQSEELGGKRSFFDGDFARFGWAKLMHSGLGGFETLNLYAEALQSMPRNPGIPQLFRDIFNNAYLPYRDPETLRAFLKVIDEFNYTHSEDLGDAYEYLLSVLGAQGDAGQFRTPRHIIDFIVALVDPQKHETVLDPACGTAGFLISSYKHILAANTPDGNATLTGDERAQLAKGVTGYDIEPNMVRLARANMYLHGFADPHIVEYDTLTSEERWDDRFDVILANPPFMSPKGGIRPHQRFSVQSKRSEVLFVDYMAEHLTPGGRAGIIVPEGIIFQSQSAYKQLRKMLVEEYLVAVISLPSGLFQPYSGVKTSILILDRSLARRTKTIMFSRVANVGISLGARRDPIPENDLPGVLADFAAHAHGEPPPHQSWIATRDEILAAGTELTGERFRPMSSRAESHYAPLGDVCDIIKGTFSSTTTPPGPYPLVVTAQVPLTADTYQLEGECVCVPLISSSGHGKASLKRIHYASGKFAVANLLAALVPDTTRLEARYLYRTLDARKDAMAGLMTGAANVGMKPADLAQFQIPLPPLEVQREIVAEIDAYQKVIDGARTVVENYKPHVPIDPSWPLVKLGDVCSTGSGGTPSRTRGDFYEAGTIPWVKSGEVGHGVIVSTEEAITEAALKGSSAKVFPAGTVLIAMYGATAGQVAILGIDAATNQAVCGVRPCASLSNRFLLNLLLDKTDELVRLSTGGAQPNISQTIIRALTIPLPPLATQRAIVAEIEAEQALVDANRQLITRFQTKIDATLARVWGEAEAQ